MFVIRYRRMITQFDNRFLNPVFQAGDSICLRRPKLCSYSTPQLFRSSVSLPKRPGIRIAELTAQAVVTFNGEGVSRVAKSDAQAALFDYLFSTRGLSFLDADHISKNSPEFLSVLIEKLGKEKDVSRALSKFFRYHPINEFEPFFESMGLSPSEIAPLLPRGLMFLCDDQTLVDSYHTLANYGVPRSNIGRIYKEVMKMFHNELGIKNHKLTAYERLGLSRSTVIKLVTCSPLLLAGDVNREFVGFLDRLKGLGFDSNWIGEQISCKRTYNWSRILDTFYFLRDIGYDDEQLKHLMRNESGVIFEGPGKQVYIVACALLKLGLGKDEICRLISKNPQVLMARGAKNLLKALHFLFEIEMEPESIIHILCSHMELLRSHSLKGPKTMLRNFGGSKKKLCKAITEDPSTFLTQALKSKGCIPETLAARNPKNFVEKTQFLLRIGYSENTDEMVKALKKFRGRGDQLQERFDCLMNAGLDYRTVSEMVKQAPTVLNQRKEVLEKKIYYLEKYLRYPTEAIATFPSYLCYDMERIATRFSMYAWLRDRDAAKPGLSLSTLLACSDARFEKYFVNIHLEGPASWENIRNALQSVC